mgnify:FL=1
MSTFNKVGRYITDKNYRLLVNAGRGFYDSMPDRQFLELCFPAWLGYPLNLDNPKTFNEKMQWLKIYARDDYYTRLVDKYEAKRIVADKVGSKYIIPNIGVWEKPEDIDFDLLPQQFVLKCTHNSGIGMCICRDKSQLDIKKVKADLDKGLHQDYYITAREWPYKNVPRKIIAEQFMVDESGTELKDYKIFCFNGKPMYIQVDFGRFTKHERNLYSTEWDYMGFASLYPTNKEHIIPKPVCLEEMLDIASILSKGIPYMRVDLYVIGKDIFFGEMTLFHGSGFEPFTPAEWDRKLGDILILPEVCHE